MDHLDHPPREGNTKTPRRDVPSNHWLLTWCNYPEGWVDHLDRWIKGLGGFTKIVCQPEKCPTTGTPHIQGYIHFKKRHRLSALKTLDSKVHWEKKKGTELEACQYCSKEETRDGDPWIEGWRKPREIKLVNPTHDWQVEMMMRLTREPDDRTIHWIWDEYGGTGKSAFTKWLVMKMGAIVCSGKAADMKYQIAKMVEKEGGGPDIVIFDVPRTSTDYISYTGIEEIKNGCFSSPKYESTMVVTATPHVVVFANCRPEVEKMSQDRWYIKHINYQTLQLEE